VSEAPAKKGLAWPVCTLSLVLGLGALGWWSYAKWQEEQTVRRSSPQAVQQSAQAPAPQAAAPPVSPQGPPQAAAPAPSPGDAYRSLPTYFIAGFGAVMVLILGAILYLWWSLKDLEGGKRYGEGDKEP